MANELSVQTGLSYSKGGDVYSVSESVSVTVTGNPRISGRQNIGTTEEQLVLGDVTTVGIVWIKNLDSTNFITVGTVTNQRGFRINAGESFAFRAANNAVFCAANTAAVDVAYAVFSN
jgi:hypothetical protein